MRFEPGETKTVALVAIAGAKVIRGGNNLANGAVSPTNLAETMARVKAQGFANTES